MEPERKTTRRQFSTEFNAETVALIRTSGKSVAQVCRDLDLAKSAVHRWLAQADIDAGRRYGLATAERQGGCARDQLPFDDSSSSQVSRAARHVASFAFRLHPAKTCVRGTFEARKKLLVIIVRKAPSWACTPGFGGHGAENG